MSETPIPPAEAATPETQAPVVWRFEFRGSALEFFRIWLVNLLLTIATLGLFSPWAKIRTRRYFYGSAFLNGANFDYHASPWSILFARVVILLALVVGARFVAENPLENAAFTALILLLLPWALVRGFAFNARYSSHRGARFAFKKETGSAYALLSPFIVLIALPGFIAPLAAQDPDKLLAGDGGILSAVLGAILAAVFLAVLILGPAIMRAWHNFKARNHSIGPVRFHFEKPRVGAYFFPLWGMPALGFVFLAVVILPQFRLATEENILTRGPVAILSAYLVMLLVVTFIRAALFRLFWNHAGFSVGGEFGKFRANFSVADFAVRILIVNYIAIFFSLGLLYPWAKIRRARFIAASLSLQTTPAALEKIPGLRGEKETALGEEFEGAEGFDFDVGLV